MSKNKTRYLVVDYAERETVCFESFEDLKAEVTRWANEAGQKLADCMSELEVWQILTGSAPKRVCITVTIPEPVWSVE